MQAIGEITHDELNRLKAAGHAVAVYKRKGIAVVDGYKRYTVKPEPELILWGRHSAHGPLWLKLTDRTSNAEMKRWEKDGWTVLRLVKGHSPNDQ